MAKQNNKAHISAQKIENRIIALDGLKPHPRNYNKHSDSQIADLMESLRQFGLVKPIVMWRDLIIAGHGIVLAARKLGWAKIEARVLPSEWRESKALAYLAADNELARRGDPDQAQLARIVADVAQAESEVLARLAAGDRDALHSLLSRAEADSDGGVVVSDDVCGGESDFVLVPPAERNIPIDEFINRRENIIVTFSGGKDSVATMLWTLDHCDRDKVRVLYCDTGIDFPYVRQYLDYIERKLRFSITRIGFADDRAWREMLAKNGYPNFTNLWCHTRLKAQILEAYYKENGLDNLDSVIVMGVRKEESKRRSKYPDRSVLGKMYAAMPILNMRATELCEYVKAHNLSLAQGYLYFDRTGCFCCPNMPQYKWRILRERYPELFAKTMEYLVVARRDAQWRKYFERDVVRFVALDAELKEPPYAAYVDVDDIERVLAVSQTRTDGNTS